MKRLADLLFIWGPLVLAGGWLGGYLVCEGLGWRAYASVLSGTLPPGPAGSAEARAALGLVYVLAYLGATLLAPVLALMAGLQLLTPWLLKKIRSSRPAKFSAPDPLNPNKTE